MKYRRTVQSVTYIIKVRLHANTRTTKDIPAHCNRDIHVALLDPFGFNKSCVERVRMMDLITQQPIMWMPKQITAMYAKGPLPSLGSSKIDVRVS